MFSGGPITCLDERLLAQRLVHRGEDGEVGGGDADLQGRQLTQYTT